MLSPFLGTCTMYFSQKKIQRQIYRLELICDVAQVTYPVLPPGTLPKQGAVMIPFIFIVAKYRHLHYPFNPYSNHLMLGLFYFTGEVKETWRLDDLFPSEHVANLKLTPSSRTSILS